jgi:hypothetical protein
MKTKNKLLFIVSEFWQAGGERQTFEINQALNKELFEVNILCDLPLNSDSHKKDYYFDKHLVLNSPIRFMDEFKWKEKLSLWRNSGKKVSIKKNTQEIASDLNFYFEQFNHLLIFGEYTYRNLSQYISESVKQKSSIFIHNSKKQVPNNYLGFEKSLHLNFVSGYNENDIKIELDEFESFTHFHFPLSISCDVNLPQALKQIEAKRIAIFTRLTIHKPLDVFYYALHSLKNYTTAELHIFGVGNPEDFEFNKCLDYLNLKNKVYFRGHVENIQETVFNENIDLIWAHGYYGEPGGFASFDLCLTEVPQLFWDFTLNEFHDEYHEFPNFSRLDEFVNKTFELLNEKFKRIKLGQLQKEFVLKNKNIQENIKDLEAYLIEKCALG